MERDTIVFDLEELVSLGSWEALVSEIYVRIQEERESEGEIDLHHVASDVLVWVDVEYSVNGGNNAS